MMKNTKTPTRPKTDWLPLSQTKGSLASVPSAIRKECENTTDSAASSRSASKLLPRRSPAPISVPLSSIRPVSPGRAPKPTPARSDQRHAEFQTGFLFDREVRRRPFSLPLDLFPLFGELGHALELLGEGEELLPHLVI